MYDTNFPVKLARINSIFENNNNNSNFQTQGLKIDK